MQIIGYLYCLHEWLKGLNFIRLSGFSWNPASHNFGLQGSVNLISFTRVPRSHWRHYMFFQWSVLNLQQLHLPLLSVGLRVLSPKFTNDDIRKPQWQIQTKNKKGDNGFWSFVFIPQLFPKFSA